MLPPEINIDVISEDSLRQLNRIVARTHLGLGHGRYPQWPAHAKHGAAAMDWDTLRCHRPATQAVQGSIFPATAQFHRSCLGFRPSGIAALCPAPGISDTLNHGPGSGGNPARDMPHSMRRAGMERRSSDSWADKHVLGLLGKMLAPASGLSGAVRRSFPRRCGDWPCPASVPVACVHAA